MLFAEIIGFLAIAIVVSAVWRGRSSSKDSRPSRIFPTANGRAE